MEKSLCEQMGGTYTLVGDYYLPNFLPAEQEEKPIGVWGGSGTCGISSKIARYCILIC